MPEVADAMMRFCSWAEQPAIAPGLRRSRLAVAGSRRQPEEMSIQEPAGERFASFEAFYPYYIHEHSNRTCRRIHIVGSGLVLVALVAAIATANPWWLLAMPLIGYGFAWVGHFFFEKNRPATFRYPLWSLMGDWRMFFETISGRRRF
jgi:hypothetical protein